MRIYPTNPAEDETLRRARIEAVTEGVTYGRWMLEAVRERLARIDGERNVSHETSGKGKRR